MYRFMVVYGSPDIKVETNRWPPVGKKMIDYFNSIRSVLRKVCIREGEHISEGWRAGSLNSTFRWAK
jgi:hypothetical protein